MRHKAGLWAVVVLALWLPVAAAAEVRVFVPGALAPALEEIAATGDGPAFRVVSGHSPAQARQIAEGAPADLFISADLRWMDFLRDKGLLVPGSEARLAATHLVLIAPAGRPMVYGGQGGESLAAQLGDGRLAIGDPDSVPAGRFARAALDHLGAWEGVAGRLALLPDVRGVVAMVARGEVAAGIGFASEIGPDPAVRVVLDFPAEAAPAVVFPIAILTGHDDESVRRVYQRILGPQGWAVLRAHGFSDPGP
jgi:molybdate transport system substrate-binding protein